MLNKKTVLDLSKTCMGMTNKIGFIIQAIADAIVQMAL
jgi:hypothetical protein